MKRVILVSGKGGVGKTTIAAATAVAAARRGHRTLVLSFDLAHSLSDSFNLDCSLFDQHGGLPLRMAENLDLQEVDVQEQIERQWGDLYHYIGAFFSSMGMSGIVAEEVAIMPGMEDLIALMAINQHYREDTYDLIVVDCPPTSESLRFVNLMTSIDWYVRKRFKTDRAILKVARPIASKLIDYPLPQDSYFDSLKNAFGRLEGIDELLKDPEVTSVRLVTNAEKMVVRETQRAYTYFCMYGMNTDGVIINRLISSAEGYLAGWVGTHANYAAQIEKYFDPIPVSRVPLFGDEVVGIDRLAEVGRVLFGDQDPAARQVDAPPFSFEKADGIYRLKMVLPFVEKDEIVLTRNEHELIVRISSFKRHVALPRSLAQFKTTQARMEGNELSIDFK